MALADEAWRREVVARDLALFYEQQLDAEAVAMAALTAREPANRPAFDAHWSRICADAGVIVRTIECVGCVAGHVAIFGPPVEREVTYRLGRSFWGNGIASRALALYRNARAAKDSAASIRVLEKCGFDRIGEDKCFANGRGKVVEEVLYMLKG